jgi:hypothetical protein
MKSFSCKVFCLFHSSAATKQTEAHDPHHPKPCLQEPCQKISQVANNTSTPEYLVEFSKL